MMEKKIVAMVLLVIFPFVSISWNFVIAKESATEEEILMTLLETQRTDNRIRSVFGYLGGLSSVILSLGLIFGREEGESDEQALQRTSFGLGCLISGILLLWVATLSKKVADQADQKIMQIQENRQTRNINQ